MLSLPQAEPELLAAARQGAPVALQAVMRGNSRRLFRIARGILGDEAEAEDVVQETYLRAFTNMPEFRGEAALSTWLARIAINEALGRLRRRRHMVGVEALDAEAEKHSSPGGGPEAEAARSELRRVLERAIEALPSPFRHVFIACAIEQMPLEAAAAAFGLPLNTVKTRLHRARRMLRDSLGAAFASALEDVFPFAGARCERISATVLGLLDSRRFSSGGLS